MKDVTPIPKKKRKPSKKATIAQCDSLFSKLVRSRGACENCGSTEFLQCAHAFTRSYKRIRWDERNAFCLCRACHAFFTHRPIEWERWLRERWGDEFYEGLQLEATYYDGPKPSLDAIRAALVEQWGEVA